VKHREIGAEVGFVRIQERAIPIEQDCADERMCDFHGDGIVSDLSDWEKWQRVWRMCRSHAGKLFGVAGRQMSLLWTDSDRQALAGFEWFSRV
jgi:hypothetical protein